MMSLMKRRAEAARSKRIEHVFSKADINSKGKLTSQQMLRLFASNGEVSLVWVFMYLFIKKNYTFYTILAVIQIHTKLNFFFRLLTRN